MTGSASDTAIDTVALKERYAKEREKRMSSGGSRETVPIEEHFPTYLDDPYVETPIDRARVEEEVDVVLIGAGFGGMMMGAQLDADGISDFRIIDRASDFGGAWYWNRYPGAQCDTEAYVYLPLLEETGYIPAEKYAHGPEIFAHAQRIARQFRLYERAYLQTEVTGLTWDEVRQRWLVSTDRDDRIAARFVTVSQGPVAKPKLPNIRGIETFQGHSFHTSRWDYEYTGGDSTGGLTGLAGKRVGVLGTGATALQCVPHLAQYSGHLYVFQRTPAAVLPRLNKPTDPSWVESLEPGWQTTRRDNFQVLTSGGQAEEDLVGDGWTQLFRDIGKEVEGLGQDVEKRQLMDFQKMEEVRHRVDELVADPATADLLKPYYNLFCRRPGFHDAYLQTFNRDNVTLVDVGRGVEAITERGMVVDGIEIELDCIVYATGFEFFTPFQQRTGYDLIGRDGRSLTDEWSSGVSTFHGLMTRGFPNCFQLVGAQAAYSHNFTFMLDKQSRHISHIIKKSIEKGIGEIEPSQEAQDAWVKHIVDHAHIKLKFDRECTPSYLNFEGQASEITSRNGFYPLGSLSYVQMLEEWRKVGAMEGLEARPAAA
jgi:cation diffusion facilitator CzcD-associated flavoprotein CzcO